jgi:hypothetical protein
MDVMLDIETLGTKPDCVVVTFGAVKFNPHSDSVPDSGMYVRLNADEQIAHGRSVEDDTLQWWMTQPEPVREEAIGDGDRCGVTDFIQQLNRFLVGVDAIWAQGPAFDMVILENLYRQWGYPQPWLYYQIRDSRTLFKVHGDPRVAGRDGHHNALADCVYQAQGVQQIYQSLNIQPRWPNVKS